MKLFLHTPFWLLSWEVGAARGGGCKWKEGAGGKTKKICLSTSHTLTNNPKGCDTDKCFRGGCETCCCVCPLSILLLNSHRSLRVSNGGCCIARGCIVWMVCYGKSSSELFFLHESLHTKFLICRRKNKKNWNILGPLRNLRSIDSVTFICRVYLMENSLKRKFSFGIFTPNDFEYLQIICIEITPMRHFLSHWVQ